MESQRVGYDRVTNSTVDLNIWGWWASFHVLIGHLCVYFGSVQFSAVAQSCPTLCNPMNCSMPGLPVHHHLLEFTQSHVHRVSDAIQPSHPLSSLSPPAPILPASESFPMSQLFAWGDQSTSIRLNQFGKLMVGTVIMSPLSQTIILDVI